MLQELSNDVRLNPTTGYILEKDALAIETKLRADLYNAIVAPGDASAVSCQVSRTDDLSATKTMHVTVQVLPLGYLKTIEITIGFVNPALALVA
jgi:hypothetical protein